MTEAQRDYLADLAARKGVKLTDTDDKTVAWASAKIEELKALPDVTFEDVTEDEETKIGRGIEKARKELKRWTFIQ